MDTFRPGLKTVEDAIEIRRRVFAGFRTCRARGLRGRTAQAAEFVVVGAGPTGVELAGTLAEICRHALAQDFRSIDPRRTRIHLVEGGPHVLPHILKIFRAARWNNCSGWVWKF